jgi:hypothetical protein
MHNKQRLKAKICLKLPVLVELIKDGDRERTARERLSAIAFLGLAKSYFCGVSLRKKQLFGFQPTATHSSPKTASS